MVMEKNDSKAASTHNIPLNVSGRKKAVSIALRKTLPFMLGLLFCGIGYGLYMRSEGFSPFVPVCMAASIFAGGMEFITVGLLAVEFNPLYALLLTFIVNGRHIFYGITMLEPYSRTGWKKYFLVSGLIDEALSLNYKEDDMTKDVDRGWFMLAVTLLLYLSWVMGTFTGAFFCPDAVARIKGIGFVMTALFIVIFINQWQSEQSHGASLTGLIAALVCLPIFGPSYFMLPALVVAAIIFSLRWKLSPDAAKTVNL